MSWDPAWEKVFQEQEWGQYPGESLIRFIASNYYLSDRQNIRLLELGCGPGANVWFMAREGFDTYGLDGSQTAIDKASKRMGRENLNAHLMTGDVSRLPFNDNYFDGVVEVECLSCNNAESTEQILAETKRVIKKGGLFYSRTFNNETFVGNIFNKTGYLEYVNVSDGPFEGKGLVRLTEASCIGELYGKYFNIQTIDRLEHTTIHNDINYCA